jgi:hypothetical protein
MIENQSTHIRARKLPNTTDASTPHANCAMLCKLAAPELLMLSKGLPPPLRVLPDFMDCASAGDVLVLLADVDCACEG